MARLRRLNLKHPLRAVTWLPLAVGLKELIAFLGDGVHPAVLSARLLNAAFCGMGVGAMFLVMSAVTGNRGKATVFAVSYSLFSSSAIIAIPDHFGISSGLLAVSLAIFLSAASPRTRIVGLSIMAVLLGGTTITNVLFPILAIVLVWYQTKPLSVDNLRQYRTPIGIAGLSSVCALSGLVYWSWERIISKGTGTQHYLNWRLFSDPFAALKYLYAGITYPAVAPAPHLVNGHITFEPLSLIPAGLLPMAAATLVLTGALVGAWSIWRTEQLRPLFFAAIGWLAFNQVLNNIWGDEYFLFSPHWAWCIILLLSACARHIPLLPLSLSMCFIGLAQASFFASTHALLLRL